MLGQYTYSLPQCSCVVTRSSHFAFLLALGKKVILLLESLQKFIFLWLVIVVPYWCKWYLLPCPQHALIMVQMGNFGVIAARLQSCQYTLYACVFKFENIYAAKWPVLSTCMHLILFIWHVISMLSWMLSLSDSYPSKLWFLCAELHVYLKNHGWQNIYFSASNMYAFNPVYMMYNQYVMLDVKFEWCLLHHCLRICQMFILID